MLNTVKFEGNIKNITVRGTEQRNVVTATVSQYAGVSPTGQPRCNAFVNVVAFSDKAKAMLNALMDIQERMPSVIIEGQLSYYRAKDDSVRQQVIVESVSLVESV